MSRAVGDHVIGRSLARVIDSLHRVVERNPASGRMRACRPRGQTKLREGVSFGQATASERSGGTPDRPMTRVSWLYWSPDGGRTLRTIRASSSSD